MKYFLIGMALIFLFVSCNLCFGETVIVDLDDHVSDDIVDLGILVYSDTVEKALTVKINNCSDEIILMYLFSDINDSALSIESSWYSFLENQTTIIFKTNKIIPKWYFKNNTRQFIYMDNNSKTLFRIYIDYSNVLLPDNPLDSLTEQNIDLFENLSIFWEKYNQTYIELNFTSNNLVEKWDLLNDTKSKYDQLNESVIQLTENNKNLQDGIKVQVDETNKYKAWYKSKKEDNYDLKKDNEGMEDALGKWPYIFICALFLEGFFIILWLRRKTIFKAKSVSMEDADTEIGYTQEARLLDKFKSFGSKKKDSISDSKTKVKDNYKIEMDQEIGRIHNRIDIVTKKHEQLETRYTNDILDIRKKIDNVSIKKTKKTKG